MFRADDAQGNRLKDQVNARGGTSEMLNNCRSKCVYLGTRRISQYSRQRHSGWLVTVKLRLEKKATLRHEVRWPTCVQLIRSTTRVFLRLSNRDFLPDVMGALIVVMGNGPLDRSATMRHTNVWVRQGKRATSKKKRAPKRTDRLSDSRSQGRAARNYLRVSTHT